MKKEWQSISFFKACLKEPYLIAGSEDGCKAAVFNQWYAYP